MSRSPWFAETLAALTPTFIVASLTLDERREHIQVTTFLERTLRRIDARIAAGLTDPTLPLRTLVSSPPAASPACVARPVRVAVVPISGAPPTMAHVALVLLALDQLECDTAVWLAHGHIAHKPCIAAGDEDVARRHEMARTLADRMSGPFPLVRYSDVSRHTSTPGEIAVHELMALNADRDVDVFLVLGEDSSRVRVRRILCNVVAGARRHRLSANSRHTLALALSSRGPRLPLDEDAVSERLRRAGLRYPLLRIRPPYPALHAISSTRVRQQPRPHLVPPPVLRYLSPQDPARAVVA